MHTSRRLKEVICGIEFNLTVEGLFSGIRKIYLSNFFNLRTLKRVVFIMAFRQKKNALQGSGKIWGDRGLFRRSINFVYNRKGLNLAAHRNRENVHPVVYYIHSH